MKKILFVVDVKKWAYDYRARAWKELLKGEYDIDILYLSEYPVPNVDSDFMSLNRLALNKELSAIQNLDFNKFFYIYKGDEKDFNIPKVFSHENYDGVVFFYSRAMNDRRLCSTPIPSDKTCVCINNEKWADYGSKRLFKNFIGDVKVLACCNDFVVKEFSKFTDNVMKLSQSVDLNFMLSESEVISKLKSKKKILKVGFSGKTKNVLKNYDNIKAACEKINIKFLTSENLNQEGLMSWYDKIDLLVCASKSEGGPMCILEAGARGTPVLTTKVGLSREIINNDTGTFLDGSSVDSIVEGLKFCAKNIDIINHRAINLRRAIFDNWTYDSRLHEIREVLKKLTS